MYVLLFVRVAQCFHGGLNAAAVGEGGGYAEVDDFVGGDFWGDFWL